MHKRGTPIMHPVSEIALATKDHNNRDWAVLRCVLPPASLKLFTGPECCPMVFCPLPDACKMGNLLCEDEGHTRTQDVRRKLKLKLKRRAKRRRNASCISSQSR